MPLAVVLLLLTILIATNYYLACSFDETAVIGKKIRRASAAYLLLTLLIFGSILLIDFRYLVLAPLVAITLPILMIDLAFQRIPNRINLIATFLQFITAILFGILVEWNQVLLSIVIASFSTALHLLMNILSRGQLGMGDVKLSFPIALALGLINWETVFFAVTYSFVAAGLFSIVALSFNRVNLKKSFPFGPFMIFGIWISLIQNSLLGTLLVTSI